MNGASSRLTLNAITISLPFSLASNPLLVQKAFSSLAPLWVFKSSKVTLYSKFSFKSWFRIIRLSSVIRMIFSSIKNAFSKTDGFSFGLSTSCCAVHYQLMFPFGFFVNFSSLQILSLFFLLKRITIKFSAFAFSYFLLSYLMWPLITLVAIVSSVSLH